MVRDVVVLDVGFLAAPWLDQSDLFAALRSFKPARILPVVLTSDLVPLPRRMTDGETHRDYVMITGWQAWMRLIPPIRPHVGGSDLDARLGCAGAWIEENVARAGERMRVVVVSIEAPDELLDLVTWGADMRATGQPVGVRHLLWEMNRPAADLAKEVGRHIQLADRDLWATAAVE